MPALAALTALAPAFAAAAAPAAEPPSPLVAYVATLDAASLPGEVGSLGDLRAAENALVRSPGPTEDCAQSLGAARHAALRAEVAFARQAVGDRQGALAAWQQALDCEPRNPRYRVALGNLLLSFGRLDAARQQAARAARLAPRQPGLEELQAKLDYLEQRWPEAMQRAQRIATRLQATPGESVPAGTRPDAVVAGDATGGAGGGSEAAAFWRLFALLALRRQGLRGDGSPGPDPALEERWPVPLWRFLHDDIDERGIVAAIEAQREPRRRREMACEALYYTAQHAFASGREEEGRRRLARVVNLKVLYFVEHDMALAELARLRAP